jgi:hypothetical protein
VNEPIHRLRCLQQSRLRLAQGGFVVIERQMAQRAETVVHTVLYALTSAAKVVKPSAV